MNEKLENLKEKYNIENWPQYSSFYLSSTSKGAYYYVSERIYASYDKPDWFFHEMLTLEEANWLNENSDLKYWDR